MRAIIDIGTNSVRLLMAEKDEKGEWKILRKELRSTRLGEGMTDKATIGQGAKERTLSAVGEFTAMAKFEGAKDIFAYGTSIMRDASNGEEFADEVTAAFGVPVRILSGKEEAYYSYIGAAGTSGVITSVVDIGGGSTEICVGFGTDVGARHSFRLGCVRCSKQFDTTTARGRGVGGTITSLASMLQELEVYDSSKVQDYVIHPEDVSEILEKLSQMSYDDKCHMKGLLPSRADIIVAGVVILDSLMEYFALSEITVSDRDLSEGLLDADVISPTEK